MNKERKILKYTINELKECESVLVQNGSEIRDILCGYADLQIDINNMTKGRTLLPDRDSEFPKMFIKDFLSANTSYNLILETIKAPEVKDTDWSKEVERALEFDEVENAYVTDFIETIHELIKSLEYDL